MSCSPDAQRPILFGRVGDGASETEAEPTTSRGDGDSFDSMTSAGDGKDDDSGATTAPSSTSTSSSDDETDHGVDDGVHETGEPDDDTGKSDGSTGGNLEDGCAVNDDCEDAEYCNFPDLLCGAGDMGSCVPRPEGRCPGIYAPVCGCNGQTLDNVCEAGVAGIAIMGEGECE